MIFFSNPRSVTASDVAGIERKLLQTMEMVVAKKKRIAMAEREMARQQQEAAARAEAKSGSWWRKFSMVRVTAFFVCTKSHSHLRSDKVAFNLNILEIIVCHGDTLNQMPGNETPLDMSVGYIYIYL